MSRRTVTLAVAGALVVVLSAVAALLPVPYVALNPGPVSNTLGSAGKEELIRIEGREVFPTEGRLDLTTVSVLGGPAQRLDLVTALRGWLDDDVAVVPEEQVYPSDSTAEEIEEESAAEMLTSQENATTAALRHLGIAVETHVFVQEIPDGSPSRDKLRVGDELLSLDGEDVIGSEQLRDLVTARDVGDEVRVTVRRGSRERSYTITTEAAEDDGRALIGVTTRDDAEYPFDVEIRLEDVGGPSAGLMFALGIVDKLTPGPLTGGKHIAGTGTIDDEGRVDSIGGITQKMIGARQAGATIFLSPGGNCAEARDTRPEGLRLVRAETLSDAVLALDRIREGRGNVPTC